MADSQLIVGTAWPLSHDDLAAAVLEVLCLGMTLGSITKDGDGLVLEESQVRIVVVVNSCRHCRVHSSLGEGSVFSATVRLRTMAIRPVRTSSVIP